MWRTLEDVAILSAIVDEEHLTVKRQKQFVIARNQTPSHKDGSTNMA